METDVVVPDEGKHSMPGLPRQLAIPTKDVGRKTPPGHTPGARRSLQHDQTFTPQLWFPLPLLSSPSVHMQVVGHLSTLKARSSFELRHYRGSYSRGIRCISSSVCTELLLSPAGPSLESRLAAYRTSGVDDDERQSCPFLFFSSADWREMCQPARLGLFISSGRRLFTHESDTGQLPGGAKTN